MEKNEGGLKISEGDFVIAMKTLASTALAGDDNLTRKHAIFLMGLSHDPRCIPVLIQALKDPEKVIRSQAMQALVMIGEPASKDLFGLLQDHDWRVRYRAAEALGMLGSTNAGPPLIRLLSDEKDHVRYMAAKSLGMIRFPAAREPLENLSTDENTYVREMASTALYKIG